MANCLKTQLKATVENDNIPYFGGAEIQILSNASGSIKTNSGQTAKLISKTDGTVFDISNTTIVALSALLEHGSKYIYVSAYDSFLSSADDSYSAKGLRGLKTNIMQWKNVNPQCLDRIILTKTDNNFTGSVDALPASNETTSINLNSGPSATLSSIIEKYPNIGKNNGVLTFYENTRVTGNVSALGGLHYMPSTLQLAPNITGNIYDAIVGWRTNIGETGETPNIIGSSKVSLWSVQFNTSTSTKVSWTANTSSVRINGVTTTFDNSGNIIT
jgi:hypothetical protein